MSWRLGRGAALVGIVLWSTPAWAGSAMLDEDESRRSTVMQDVITSFGVGVRGAYFDTEVELDPNIGFAPPIRDGVGAQSFQLLFDLHILRSLGVSFGYFQARSSEGGADVRVVDSTRELVPGESISDDGFFLGIEANPIGYGATQLSVGLDMLSGDGFSWLYHAGVRFDLGDFVVAPRFSYADWDIPITDDALVDSEFGSSFIYGLGFSLSVTYVLVKSTP